MSWPAPTFDKAYANQFPFDHAPARQVLGAIDAVAAASALAVWRWQIARLVACASEPDLGHRFWQWGCGLPLA